MTGFNDLSTPGACWFFRASDSLWIETNDNTCSRVTNAMPPAVVPGLQDDGGAISVIGRANGKPLATGKVAPRADRSIDTLKGKKMTDITFNRF